MFYLEIIALLIAEPILGCNGNLGLGKYTFTGVCMHHAGLSCLPDIGPRSAP